jgi:predicted nicotinamide N-methyase
MQHQFTYTLKRQQERFGSVTLDLEVIADLNETIDRLFEELERTGDGSLLEELCPYFGTIWPSARALSEWVVESSARLQGKRVLEVGCGLAIPSLVASKLGARVSATDFHPDVPKFLKKNLELNSLEIDYVPVDWRSLEAIAGAGEFDFVIGSDVLYERQHAIQLAQTVARLVSPTGEIWVADPARPYLQGFADEMERLGFQHRTEIRAVPEKEGKKEIFLLKFTSSRRGSI